MAIEHVITHVARMVIDFLIIAFALTLTYMYYEGLKYAKLRKDGVLIMRGLAYLFGGMSFATVVLAIGELLEVLTASEDEASLLGDFLPVISKTVLLIVLVYVWVATIKRNPPTIMK